MHFLVHDISTENKIDRVNKERESDNNMSIIDSQGTSYINYI